MAFGFCIGVALLLSLWSRAETAGIPDGVLRMECHDRYFMIAVDPSFTGDEPHFEAVDETGAYAITQQYAAQCGYSINVHPLPGHVELRASYFSCQTQNKDDEMFTFNFNLNVTQEGKEVTYPLNKTCSPSLPWSPREVTCETNYMEVSVRSEVTCPSGTKKDDWNSLKPAHRSTTSDWQVMFQTDDVQLPPMNISDAHEGLYHESGYMMWETPEMLYPNLDGQQVNVGLKGELVAQPVAEERGYIVGKQNNTIQICIPENAEGRYRKSAVDEDLYEFYVYHLYLEQILVDEDRVETRIRFLRTLATPLLPSPIFAENQTVLEENMFTVYLGDVPEDVQLAAVHLNGQEFTVPLNASSFIITKVVHPNNTHGYKLKVPFEDPVVLQQFSKTDAVLHYILNINYTLTVLPEKDLYYHMESVVALVTDVSPPQFDAVCTESGISFKLDHRPFDYLWEITIDSDLLTSELADQHGYIMSNDSNSLLLEVPLFSHGYEYKNISLKGFFGTFEIIMRDLETSEVQGSTIKTCLFSTTELIMCSTDGRMTVVADLALAIPNGGNPARTNLRDKYCGPKETDGSRALFSFSLNRCGSAIKLNSENVIYQNEIFYSKKFLRPGKVVSDNATERVTMQCTYPLSGLHRLFSVYRFESDAAGIGSLLHTTHPAAGLQNPTIQPTSALTTTLATTTLATTTLATTTLATTTLATTTLAATRRATVSYKPALHPPARYVKVTSFQYPANARFRYLANAMTKTRSRMKGKGRNQCEQELLTSVRSAQAQKEGKVTGTVLHGVALLLSLWSRAETAGIPDGVLRMECHDRYFMIAVDPSFTGDEPHFEAVDETGAYAITRQYAAQCGYSINVHPLPGHVELRASYFSCQTQNKDDEMFTFNFNLNVTQEGKEVTYPLNKTCSPSLPWSPREVTCETNYMEVSVRSEVTCPSGTKKDDWNSLKPAHRSTTSDWQVMFQTDDVQLPPMNISDARKQGYVFLLTEGRLVFRAPYGQPESFSTEVNGVPVEAVHATIFSRQSWVVLMVDFVAACSMDGQQVNVGLKGELVAQPVAEERGYIVGKQNNTIQICIPENAEGRYRKSAVDEDLYEFYVYHLYLEQILVDEDRVETRIRFLRTLATPLLPSPIFAENQTVLEENMFTVYLGDVPEDVQLAAVHLNGQEFTVPLNASSFIITKVVHPNNTHGYKLKVPFEDPVVLQQFSKTDAVLHYILNINYTLTVLPEKDLYYHMESVVALVTDVSPPQFDAVCTESGISFKLDHRPFDYLWEITIDSDLLTSELADHTATS
ncbi:Zona pellucida sperm-binding protein 2 [Dissostichus eleginoides]|uniref:Zona pellucida sperm-binding protein 2 n=1 Tax=Dissostichus eleginoides TaxID=100907 RepID=A0AAD9F6R3_DISEL|nr:Zona pellucida sperm-binding protein 2 [Dissostichus eleginoides]